MVHLHLTPLLIDRLLDWLNWEKWFGSETTNPEMNMKITIHHGIYDV